MALVGTFGSGGRPGCNGVPQLSKLGDARTGLVVVVATYAASTCHSRTGGPSTSIMLRQQVWAGIERVDQFERWWPWLQEFRLEGESLTAGSVLHGVVVPPLPYRMRIRVALTRCEAPVAIDAVVTGDLEGQAEMRMQPHRRRFTYRSGVDDGDDAAPDARRQSIRAARFAVGSRPGGGDDAAELASRVRVSRWRDVIGRCGQSASASPGGPRRMRPRPARRPRTWRARLSRAAPTACARRGGSGRRSDNVIRPSTCDRTPTDHAGRGAQATLCRREGEGGRGGEHRAEREPTGLGHVGHQHGEGAPGEREPGVGVDQAPEQLPVVGHDEERAEHHEGQQGPSDAGELRRRRARSHRPSPRP